MRAVASLEMRMRVVASFEISNSQGTGGSIYASGSRALGKPSNGPTRVQKGPAQPGPRNESPG